MSNLIAVLRPYWKCLQQMNDFDRSVSIESHLHYWDEIHRTNVKYFDPSQISEKTEEEKIKFYIITPAEQNALLDEEVNQSIRSTDLFVPEQRVFSGRNLSLSGEERHQSEIPKYLISCIESIAFRKVRSEIENFYKIG